MADKFTFIIQSYLELRCLVICLGTFKTPLVHPHMYSCLSTFLCKLSFKIVLTNDTPLIFFCRASWDIWVWNETKTRRLWWRVLLLIYNFLVPANTAVGPVAWRLIRVQLYLSCSARLLFSDEQNMFLLISHTRLWILILPFTKK